MDQLVRWRSDDPGQKVGGLVMEVKDDVCRQVWAMLQPCGRGANHVEVGLETDVCCNPLHNGLARYAVANVIARLLNNLFGKSKEPSGSRRRLRALRAALTSAKPPRPGHHALQRGARLGLVKARLRRPRVAAWLRP